MSPKKLLLTVDDYRKEAETKLNKMELEYYNGGADEELTLARNEKAFQSLLIVPRCLRDVSEMDTTVEWFGSEIA
ncbi:unnamed protein product [Strongylus vulgaris]|uniref:FMN hydroxy acid dehydrogenase domain-containing protein n=1 Tax=Strongylus vulgaris TaxID=40348 RepID=A0A3P7IVI2_STRVU|nr:unnamed protein product [Strongylus vulgaris]